MDDDWHIFILEMVGPNLQSSHFKLVGFRVPGVYTVCIYIYLYVAILCAFLGWLSDPLNGES